MLNRILSGLISVGVGLLTVGCGIIFPGQWLSTLVLSPDVSCAEAAAELELGELRETGDPSVIGLQFEAFEIASANGQPLRVWYVPAQLDGALEPDPQGTILIMHGTDGTLPCTLPWIAVAANNRMHAVVLDYQGYGSSGGSADIATLLDDAEATLNWVIADASPARAQVHLLGISLGSGPALGLATLRDYPQIQSIALDSPFDPEWVLSAIESSVGLFFPLTGVSARLAFGWLFETRSRLAEVDVPVVVLHGTDDMTSPAVGAENIYAALGTPTKAFWLFEDLDHVQALFLAQDDYVSLLVTFWRDPTQPPDPDAHLTDATIQIPQLHP